MPFEEHRHRCDLTSGTLQCFSPYMTNGLRGCVTTKYDVDVAVQRPAKSFPHQVHCHLSGPQHCLLPPVIMTLRRRLDASQILETYCPTMRLPPVLSVYGMLNILRCL